MPQGSFSQNFSFSVTSRVYKPTCDRRVDGRTASRMGPLWDGSIIREIT